MRRSLSIYAPNMDSIMCLVRGRFVTAKWEISENLIFTSRDIVDEFELIFI